ncbi:MAG: gluconate 2-dehydrogenase subunit 3 family protein [Flavobacteriaceae bacterium]
MDRRNALKNIGKGLGTITLTPSILNLFQSCQNSTTLNSVFFNNEQFLVVSKLMEIIIPETETPGAISLKLPEFIDAYVYNVRDEDNISSKEVLKGGLNKFIDLVKLETKKEKINKISVKEWEDQLRKVLISEDNNNKITIAIKDIRKLAVGAYKINEFVGEKLMSYNPVPGKQKGCIDLNEASGGRVWSGTGQ